MSKEDSTYGFNPHMTFLLAVYVWVLRRLKKETWRGIACEFFPYDKSNDNEDLEMNQLYGMDVVEAASKKLGFKKYIW